MMPPSLANGLSHARVVVCAGTGGVGKTTIAAALGIEAARQGRRTLVLTIDPARRLADALGLSGLDSKPMPVDLPEELFESVDETGGAARGRLDALMLDPKPTFDRLVTRLTRDEDARRRILENRIYRHLSEALAGSAEYAAMEQVHEMVESGSYDLVIVDTPPSNHALDFLSAPRRLREFLESRFVQALVRPAMTAGMFGFKIFGRSLRRMFGLLERIAGIGFLDDLTEFLTAIDGLSEGFRERATRVEEVLLGAETSYILVCGNQAGTEPGTLEFLDELDELGVQLAAVVVNRVRPWPPSEPPGEWLARLSDEAVARDEATLRAAFESIPIDGDGARRDASEAARLAVRLVDVLRETAEACDDASQTLDVLGARAAGLQIACHAVPEMADDVDRLEGLVEIGEVLRERAKPTAATSQP